MTFASTFTITNHIGTWGQANYSYGRQEAHGDR